MDECGNFVVTTDQLDDDEMKEEIVKLKISKSANNLSSPNYEDRSASGSSLASIDAIDDPETNLARDHSNLYTNADSNEIRSVVKRSMMDSSGSRSDKQHYSSAVGASIAANTR